MDDIARPARSRGLSFRSDKSGGSKGKLDLTESPQEKARRDSIWKNTSKANPNAALNEAQPGGKSAHFLQHSLSSQPQEHSSQFRSAYLSDHLESLHFATMAQQPDEPSLHQRKREPLANKSVNEVANLTEAVTLQSIRDTQHKDANGNVIVDPDLSNPTRPRLERPLDTIRSFEKAIDQGYKRRSSSNNDQSNQYASRRSSYYGGNDGRHSAMGGGYYGNQRPGSSMDANARMRYGNRMQSDGAIGGYGRPYNAQHGYHQSQDTMNTGGTNGSDSTGPWNSNTDPSSENSSIEQNGNGKQPAYGSNGYGQNGYGPNGYGSPPIMEEQGQIDYGYGGAVQVPQQQQPRRPIPLGNTGDAPAPLSGKLPSTARPAPEDKKKKGWLKRRFSKGN
ncbi:hypothetical protein EJ03DRAFT_15582 [Teratosphaeria nubilosa]|uniref:DUF2406 domain-containing protein n=1 Tax=Teratosphaeria nubilosa TaxID=161662 RepID=A0A6G1KWX7_9PEZI|nr:hypothetical protein EJ03DRAFT_15582 [Teratosphaeria nubilosa]